MDWTPEKMIDAMRRCANPTSRCMVKDCPAAALVEHRCQDLMIAWGAEQIERDQKEIAELREKNPQWIRCKDRMPPDRTAKYLVTFRGAAGALVDVAKYFPGETDGFVKTGPSHRTRSPAGCRYRRHRRIFHDA